MATETNNVLDFRDPGAMSEELLSVPGFVNELKNHTLAVAPRPNEEIATAVAKQTGWSAYQVQSVFTGVMEETIRDAQETGNVCGKDNPDPWRGMWFMIWGHDTLCNGKYVRMSGDDSVTWSCTLADRTPVIRRRTSGGKSPSAGRRIRSQRQR